MYLVLNVLVAILTLYREKKMCQKKKNIGEHLFTAKVFTDEKVNFYLSF